jgi:hypothetical protein
MAIRSVRADPGDGRCANLQLARPQRKRLGTENETLYRQR